MGLDISFNKAAAVAAGIKLSKRRNGSDEDIDRASQVSEEGYVDESYLKWLRKEELVMAVPGTDHCVVVDEYSGNLTCRANQWGHTYAPLTAFLKEHGIKWTEF